MPFALEAPSEFPFSPLGIESAGFSDEIWLFEDASGYFEVLNDAWKRFDASAAGNALLSRCSKVFEAFGDRTGCCILRPALARA